MAELCSLKNNKFLDAADVANTLSISKSTAYRIIKQLNDNLRKSGKITVSGKVSSKYFYENVYL